MLTTNFYKLFTIACISLTVFSCSVNENIEEENEESKLDIEIDSDDILSSQKVDKGDLELWKITFPVNSSGNLSGNSDAAENKDLEAWLNDNPNDDYFFENGAKDKLSFIAPHNGATTSNSGGVRCELRERVYKSGESGDTIDAEWDGSNGFHVMQFRMRVREIPNSDRLTFAQIHDTGSALDDVIQLGVKPNSADNDRLWVTVQGSIITGPNDNAQYQPLFRYDIGDWENMKLQCSNNEVKVKRKVGNSFETVFVKNIHDKWPNEDMDGEYFKAGVYLQGSPSSGEGEVQFSRITFKHP